MWADPTLGAGVNLIYKDQLVPGYQVVGLLWWIYCVECVTMFFWKTS